MNQARALSTVVVNSNQQAINNRAMRALVLIFYATALMVQILVIGRIIPYQWVNGGMSVSYEAQATQSVVSMVITLLLFLFVWRLAGLAARPKAWRRRVLYAVTVFWALGLLMQLIGTPFERYVMSCVLLAGVCGHVLLIRKLSPPR